MRMRLCFVLGMAVWACNHQEFWVVANLPASHTPVPPRATRKSSGSPALRIDLKSLQISYVPHGKKYPIAAGQKDNLGESHTPTGIFTITAKVRDPVYLDAHGQRKAAPYTKDENNVYGTRFIQLNKVINGRHLGIHGTNEPELLGTYASHACIRMRNQDIETIFNQINVGDTVEIL